MTRPLIKFSKTFNSAGASFVLGFVTIVAFIGALGFSPSVKAESAFPKDVWAAELIEPEPPLHWPKKTSANPARGSAGRFAYDPGVYVPLPERNPRKPISLVKPVAESLITTGAIEKAPKPAPLELPKSSLARKYCVALKGVAENARLEWQKRDLEKVKILVEEKTSELKKKISELEKWFDRRSAIAKDYEKRLKHIYKQMQPDNAANQLGSMKAGIAKKILLQLGPGEAAAILDEMEPAKAAALTSLIAMEAQHLAKQSKAIKKIAGNMP